MSSTTPDDVRDVEMPDRTALVGPSGETNRYICPKCANVVVKVGDDPVWCDHGWRGILDLTVMTFDRVVREPELIEHGAFDDVPV